MVEFSYYRALEAECKAIREDYEKRYPISDFYTFVPDEVLFEEKKGKKSLNYLGSFDSFRYLPGCIPKIKRPKFLRQCPSDGENEYWEYLFKGGKLRYVSTRFHGRRMNGTFVVTDSGFYEVNDNRIDPVPSAYSPYTEGIWYIDPKRKRYLSAFTAIILRDGHYLPSYENKIEESVLSEDEKTLDWYVKGFYLYYHLYDHYSFTEDETHRGWYLQEKPEDSNYFVRSQDCRETNPIVKKEMDEVLKVIQNEGYIEAV